MNLIIIIIIVIIIIIIFYYFFFCGEICVHCIVLHLERLLFVLYGKNRFYKLLSFPEFLMQIILCRNELISFQDLRTCP